MVSVARYLTVWKAVSDLQSGLCLERRGLAAHSARKAVDAGGTSAPERKCLSDKMKAGFATGVRAQRTKTLRDGGALTYTPRLGNILLFPSRIPSQHGAA